MTQPLTQEAMIHLINAIVRMEHKGGHMTTSEYTATASLCVAAKVPQFFTDYFAAKAQTATKTVSGYWIDRPQEILHGLRVSLESWNGNEQDEGVFYYTDGEPLTIGQRIAGDFIVTHIEG